MKIKANFVPDKSSESRRSRIIQDAQNYLDTELMKRMKPYIPIAPKRFKFRGNLLKSMKNPKPGKIVFLSNISRMQYFGKFKYNVRGGNPNAKRKWFEYTKRQHQKQLLAGVRKRMNKIK